MKPFLTAVWSDLILASYAVPDAILLPYLRPGLTLDRWEGGAYCSLVAFHFEQTRVLGWSVPYPTDLCDFPEFNLRFYVREGERRGVVFVREFVPSPVVAGLARLIYNEPYSVARMTSRVTQTGDVRRGRYDFTVGGESHMIAVTAQRAPSVPAPETFEHWIKEQAWGYGHLRNGRPTRYHVAHPLWRTYPIESFQIGVDVERLYGPQWAILRRPPDSLVLAEGSAVSVYPYEPAQERRPYAH